MYTKVEWYINNTKVCTDIYVQVEWYMNDERVEENISVGIIITDSSLVIQVRGVPIDPINMKENNHSLLTLIFSCFIIM